MKRPIVLLCIALASIAFLSLFVFVEKSSGPRYEIAAVNRTHRMFGDVTVLFGGKVAAAMGWLVAGGTKTFGIITLPVPDEATIEWTEKSGVHRTSNVTLDASRPLPKGVDIWFIIEEDGTFTVKYIRNGDIDAVAAIGETLKPLQMKEGE